jgi:hypothetical protein
MKLLFNKKNFEGHWFEDTEDTEGWTEKVPPNGGYTFNDELNEWVPKTREEQQD